MPDEVNVRAGLTDDMSAALGRIENRVQSVEDAVDDLGSSAAAAGKEGGAGIEKFGDKVAEAGRKAGRAKRPIGEAGDEAIKSGGKAKVGAKGFDELGEKFDKAAKKGGGLSGILKILKWSGLVTGAFALAGGVSALGAGAVIAVGGLAPLIGVLAGGLPIFAAAKLSMLAFTLASTAMEPTLSRIKNQFTALGPVIANGGLQSGLNVLAGSLGKLVKVTGTGLAGLGAELGQGARQAAALVKSVPFLNQLSAIFAGLRPIVAYAVQGLISLVGVIMDVTQAALPMAQDMAMQFRDIAAALRLWTAEQLANGKMTNWLNQSWTLFKRVVGVAVDVLIGLFNIFRIGAGYAGEMGLALEGAARHFREWTTSAEGQARINQYFQDSLPALMEMGKILAFVAKGLGGLGANANIAPLLSQIRTEFLPALMDLVTNLSGQGGLGPALISAATAIAQLFAGLDFSAFTTFVQGIASMLTAVVWLTQNVPGANLVVSSLLFGLLGFKLLGPVFGAVAGGFQAFDWMSKALSDTEKLSSGQKVFAAAARGTGTAMSAIGNAVTGTLLPAIRGIAIAGVGALRTLAVALFTTPIGWLILGIMAIVAGIFLLWTKCAWFRDLVMAVWTAIRTAALVAWEAIKAAAVAVFDALVAAATAVGSFFAAAWNFIKSAFVAVVDAIVAAAQWIWQGIQPVVKVLVAIFDVAWSIIKGIVQTAIYIIVGIITLTAIILKGIWDAIVFVATLAWQAIAAGATWLWESVIKPVIDFLVMAWNVAWTAIRTATEVVFTAIATAAQWFWDTILKPILDLIVSVWNAVWGGIRDFAMMIWQGIQMQAQAFWDFISPVFQAIGSAGSAIWETISAAAGFVWDAIKTGWSAVWDFLSGIWDKLSNAGKAVWDGIKAAAGAVADVVKGIWGGIVDAVKGVWNWIARGWNSIPSISVPDWIPIIGGKTFSLPKLPTLWHGGEAPGGAAIVGEHGPEPLVQNGRVTGMVGMGGPEIARIPVGGYVVPNLSTLSALPGLAKTLPAGVARAVASSVPGYAPVVAKASDGGLAREVRELAHAVRGQRPPIIAKSDSVRAEVESALRTIRREDDLRSGYHYGGL